MGVGANVVSWLVLQRNAVSIGASDGVLGLFAIIVLVKVMEAAQASVGLSANGRYALQSINHIAHLSGARLVGVVLVWLMSRVPSTLEDQDLSGLPRKISKSK